MSSSTLNTPRLLITGATGFVGRNLLLHAIKDPTWSKIILPVRNLEKLQRQFQQDGLDAQSSRFYFCSVEKNRWNLSEYGSIDLAIHCAGLTFSREREPYFATNVQGTRALLEALPADCRIMILSSQSAAGPSSKQVPARLQEHLENPISWYGESKLAMEKEMTALAHKRLLILRPPMILGPRDSATIPLFKMARGRVRFKPGLQKKEYSWIAVDDLCRALLMAAKSDWETLPHRNFFLSHETTITDLELIATAAAVLRTRGITLRLPHTIIQSIATIADYFPLLREAVPSLGRDRVKEMLAQRWVMDGSGFERTFSWKANTSLAQALEQTAAWLAQYS